MLDFLRYFDVFCEETGLCLTLTLEMPAGYDQANGLFDPEKNVVFSTSNGWRPARTMNRLFISSMNCATPPNISARKVSRPASAGAFPTFSNTTGPATNGSMAAV